MSLFPKSRRHLPLNRLFFSFSVSHYRAIGADRSADSSHSGHILGGREQRDRRHSKSRGDHYGVGSREREIVVLEEDYSLMLLWVRRVMAGVSFCLYLLVILLFILFATATPQMGKLLFPPPPPKWVNLLSPPPPPPKWVNRYCNAPSGWIYFFVKTVFGFLCLCSHEPKWMKFSSHFCLLVVK